MKMIVMILCQLSVIWISLLMRAEGTDIRVTDDTCGKKESLSGRDIYIVFNYWELITHKSGCSFSIYSYGYTICIKKAYHPNEEDKIWQWYLDCIRQIEISSFSDTLTICQELHTGGEYCMSDAIHLDFKRSSLLQREKTIKLKIWGSGSSNGLTTRNYNWNNNNNWDTNNDWKSNNDGYDYKEVETVDVWKWFLGGAAIILALIAGICQVAKSKPRGSQPGTELGLPDSRPATNSSAPSAPALSNETADGYMPPKYDEVIEREHLNPDAQDGRINHDHTLHGLSSGSGIPDPSSRGYLDSTERRNIITGNSANAEGEMPPPPSYDEALSGLYEAAPSEADH